PVAPRLRPFFRDLRHAARDAVPTIRDLNAAIRSPGPDSDLVELTRKGVSLRRAGVGSGPVDCGQDPKSDYLAAADNVFTQGALSEARCSLQNGLPSLAFFRAYQPELVGWFNDFGTSGVVDANGGIGRISTTFNVFSLSASGVPNILGPPADLLSSPLLDTATTAAARAPTSAPPPTAPTPTPRAAPCPATPRRYHRVPEPPAHPSPNRRPLPKATAPSPPRRPLPNATAPPPNRWPLPKPMAELTRNSRINSSIGCRPCRGERRGWDSNPRGTEGP